MRKTFLPLLVVFVLLLTACNDASSMVQTPIETDKQAQSKSDPIASELPASAPATNDTAHSSSNDEGEEPNETPLTQLPENSVAESSPETPTEESITSTSEPATAGPINPTSEPTTAEQATVPQPPTEQPKADAPKADVSEGNSTQVAPSASPTPSPSAQPEIQSHNYDMSDPNVMKRPIYATASTAKELVSANPSGTSGGWVFTSERLAAMKNEDPDYMIDGMTFYDWRVKPIQRWVDKYLSSNGLSYEGKSDYEKTEIIRKIIEDGLLEEFIGLWRPDFKFTDGDCVPRAEAIDFLMLSMNFELFAGIHCTWGEAHATNAYWDSTVGAVRFVDADNLSSWNCFVDELDEWNFVLN